MKTTIVITALVLIFLAISPHSNNCIAGWQGLPPISVPRAGIAAAALDGEIYAIGGGQGPGFTYDLVERYNPVLEQWTTITPLNHARAFAAAASANGRIFVFGGRLDPSTPIGTVEMYDPELETWEDVAELTVPREGLAAVYFQDEIWVIGGHSATAGYSGDVDAFDPANLTFSQPYPSINPMRAGHAAAASEDEIRILGGVYFGLLNLNTTWNDSIWVNETPLTIPRRSLGAVILGDSLIAFGGDNGENPLNTAECFRFSTSEWTPFDSMLFHRQAPGVTTFNGEIYAIGGYGVTTCDYGYLSSMEKYTSPLVPVDDRARNIIQPVQFRLTCYPNPFNSRVTIGVEIPPGIAEPIDISVNNIIGQTVFSYSYGLIGPGAHTFNWNGTSQEGVSLPSGIYWVSINGGSGGNIHPIVLIK
ncbi:MAG: hypothetical protein HQ591_12565 [candidate division Zixibacteria bacterium]|nr:hypothetical protein [Candidatus Tariuqbacter arcticus]